MAYELTVARGHELDMLVHGLLFVDGRLRGVGGWGGARLSRVQGDTGSSEK